MNAPLRGQLRKRAQHARLVHFITGGVGGTPGPGIIKLSAWHVLHKYGGKQHIRWQRPTRLRALLVVARRDSAAVLLPLPGRELPPLPGRPLLADRGLSVRSKTCTFSAATACGPCNKHRCSDLLVAYLQQSGLIQATVTECTMHSLSRRTATVCDEQSGSIAELHH